MAVHSSRASFHFAIGSRPVIGSMPYIAPITAPSTHPTANGLFVQSPTAQRFE
jgi:hypothetical protein